MLKRYSIRVFSCFLIALLLLPMIFSFASAEKSLIQIDQSDVEDDLKVLIPEKYPSMILDAEQNFISVAHLLEHGFDARKENFSQYGLYLYLYNPSGKELSSFNASVQLQLNSTVTGKTGVFKCGLALLDHSSDFVFYKFRVVGISEESLKNMPNANRRYWISGVEVAFVGESSIKDRPISVYYEYTGFNAGCDFGRTETYSLNYRYDNFETIEVELHPTSWMSDTSDKGEGYKYEVSGVYFAIPNYYLKKYGNWEGDEDLRGLYAVEGVFKEYKVNGLVTDSAETYIKIPTGYIGSLNEDIPFSFGDVTEEYFSAGDASASGAWVYELGVTFNYKPKSVQSVFYKNTYKAIEGLCFRFYTSQGTGISSETLLDHWNLYFTEYGNGNTWERCSAVLGADEGRTWGYQSYKVTADDAPMQFTSKDFSQTNPFLAWITNAGISKDEVANVKWLQKVEAADFVFNEQAIADKYYVGLDQAKEMINYAVQNEAENVVTLGIQGKTTYLMHFAKTDYYAVDVKCCDKANAVISSTVGGSLKGNHYYFERTIFDDFDVLQFTFKDSNGTLTSVPVISDPVDISGGLPPADDSDANVSNPDKPNENNGENGGLGWDDLALWAKIVAIGLGLVGLALIVPLVFKFLGPLLGLLGKGVVLAANGIGAVFRGGASAVQGIFSAREATYEAKRKRTLDAQADADRRHSVADRARKQRFEDEDREQAKTDRARKQRIEDEDRKQEKADHKRKALFETLDRKKAAEDRRRRQAYEDEDRSEAAIDRERRRNREDNDQVLLGRNEQEKDVDRRRRRRREDLYHPEMESDEALQREREKRNKK